MYPEDYIVKSKRLIRQWIAERFVKKESGNTLEEVAEGYLTELIHRSLVQVSTVRIDGKTKSCCVHDLIRVMILEKCEDLSFCKHINNEDGCSSLYGIIRRLSITTHSDDFPTCIENSHVRSLFLFRNESQQFLSEDFMRRIFTKYRRLKVLEFEVYSEVKLSNILHENLGSLIHLKYLSFMNFTAETRIELPNSIAMLQNLETLLLRHEVGYKIPKVVTKLRKLRHLLGIRMSLFQLKGGIGGMKSLQTLSSVVIDDDGIELIKELGKLKQLRKLSLFLVNEDHISTLSSSLNEMQHLESLNIGTKNVRNCSYHFIDLHLDSPPYMLQSLKLSGVRMVKLPEWILQHQNLVKLNLEMSLLKDDPIIFLENMRNLLFLSIVNKAYEGESLHFHDGGFQNLKELHIIFLPNLNSIVIDKGALQSLKKFELCYIPNLKTVPAGIQHLEKLEVLNVRDVPHVELYPKL
jgi:disease resistance protein RPM1